ncbi:MAG: hypothetical protein JNJ85_11535 [Candidatus Kapabacteria bacterium]|nr:hypothetical protein [Candidatus Kapabacteria bacterium]
MKNEHSPLNIEELASRCNFNKLTPTEQEFVLQQLQSAERFDELHATIRSSRASFIAEMESMQHSTTASAALHSALRNRHHTGTTLLLRPMPLYQTLLVAAACVAFVMVIYKPQANTMALATQQPDTVRTIVYQIFNRDSLAVLLADSIENVLAKHIHPSALATVARTRTNKRDEVPHIQEQESSPSVADNQSPNRFVGLANMPSVLEQKRGRTVADEPNLHKLTFTMNR